MSEHPQPSDPLGEAVYDRLRDGGAFSTPPAVLARLSLSSAAAEAARVAGGLVPTSADGYGSPAALVEYAQRLVGEAQEVLAAAVVAARARGTTWEDIGEALGISRQAAQERFRVRVADWERGLDVPYLPGGGGRILNPALPDAASSPQTVAAQLDRWVARHHEPAGPDRADRPVSAVLDNRDGWALGLSGAVLASSRRLLDRTSRLAPAAGEVTTHERTLAERKVACFEAMLVEKPGDVATLDALRDARAHLATLQAARDT